MGLVPSSDSRWDIYFERLLNEGRAGRAIHGERSVWVAAERTKSFAALFPGAEFSPALSDIETAKSPDDTLLALLTGWISNLGPVTATQLGDALGLPASEIDKALLRMEAGGAVLRGHFTGAGLRAREPAPHASMAALETEWCDRRLLARIHRLTVATLPKPIEPVSAAQFMRWLLRWQHLTP